MTSPAISSLHQAWPTGLLGIESAGPTGEVRLRFASPAQAHAFVLSNFKATTPADDTEFHGSVGQGADGQPMCLVDSALSEGAALTPYQARRYALALLQLADDAEQAQEAVRA